MISGNQRGEIAQPVVMQEEDARAARSASAACQRRSTDG
jgi:hypothetical protein